MKNKEIPEGQNRFIRVTSCNECPLDQNCKAWKQLTKQQKVFLNLSNSVPVNFMLTNCPLEQFETEQDNES